MEHLIETILTNFSMVMLVAGLGVGPGNDADQGRAFVAPSCRRATAVVYNAAREARADGPRSSASWYSRAQGDRRA